ncbi:hypothetical protein C5167_003092, partial [Papaver somniferum]
MDASSLACGTATPIPTSAATPTSATYTFVGSSIQPTYYLMQHLDTFPNFGLFRFPFSFII